GFQTLVAQPFSQWAEILDVQVPASPWIYISHPRRSGDAFILEANETGSAETLFRSTNGLSDWQPVNGAAQTATGYTIEFTHPAAPPGQVFYQIRAVAP